jgi:hypothetical protein
LKKIKLLVAALALVAAGCASKESNEFSKVAGDLDAQLSAAHTEGLPSTEAELLGDPIKAEENAAPLYVQAASLLNAAPHVTQQMKEALVAVPGSPNWEAGKSVIRQIQPSLDLAAKAAAKPHCQFKADYGEGLSLQIPEFDDIRMIANTFCWRARNQAMAGQYADAVKSVCTAWRIGDQVGEQPMLFSYLVESSIKATANKNIELICSDANGAPQLLLSLKNAEPQMAKLPSLKRAVEGDYVLMANSFKTKTLREILLDSGAVAADDVIKTFPKLDDKTLKDAFFDRCVELDRQVYKLLSDTSISVTKLDDLILAACDHKPFADRTDIFSNMLISQLYPNVAGQVSRLTTWRYLVEDGVSALQARALTGNFPNTIPTHNDPYTTQPLTYHHTGSSFTISSSGPTELRGHVNPAAFTFAFPYRTPGSGPILKPTPRYK